MMVVQVVSILLYHVLPQGAFTARELQAAGMVQTDLGTYLKESLPLTFATAGTGVRSLHYSTRPLCKARCGACQGPWALFSPLIVFVGGCET